MIILILNTIFFVFNFNCLDKEKLLFEDYKMRIIIFIILPQNCYNIKILGKSNNKKLPYLSKKCYNYHFIQLIIIISK